jgi:hypothetical protein
VRQEKGGSSEVIRRTWTCDLNPSTKTKQKKTKKQKKKLKIKFK